MNKLWIEHSHDVAKNYREDSWMYSDKGERYEYLDMIGLFETNWLTCSFEHEPDNDNYGYPR